MEFIPGNASDFLYQVSQTVFVIVKGKTKSIKSHFLISNNDGIIKWRGGINGSLTIGDIASFFKNLNGVLPILYGNVCTETEYKRLHEQIIYYEGGGRSEENRGTSSGEAWEYLPGIYWFNFFGNELTEAIGRDRIESIPGVIHEQENGATLFFLDEPADAADINERVGKLYKINLHLGNSFFFNLVNEEEQSFHHPERFKKYLEKVRTDYLK